MTIGERDKERAAVVRLLMGHDAEDLANKLQVQWAELDWMSEPVMRDKARKSGAWKIGKLKESHLLRRALIVRLDKEGAADLSDRLRNCGQSMGMTCTHCGDHTQVLTRCKKKWCPSCQRSIAAKRTARMRGAIKTFQWPLFVTLTMTNSHDPESVRKLRQAFGKLRNRKIWKSRVTAGVAAVEVTNKGAGWHPHLHALIDCRWLAIHTPEPPRGIKGEELKIYTESAQRELSANWAEILGQEMAVIHVKRAHGSTVIDEILKYSIKGSDLLTAPQKIAPMLRMLDMTRLVTTFGTLHGKGKELDALDESGGCPCDECQAIGTKLPDDVIKYLM